MNTKPYSLKLLAKCGTVRHAVRVLRNFGLLESSMELINLGETGIFLPSQLVAHIGEYRALRQYEAGGSCYTIVSSRFMGKMLSNCIIAKSGNSTKTGRFTYICLQILESPNDGLKTTAFIVGLVIKHTFAPYKTQDKLRVTWQSTRSKMRLFRVGDYHSPRDYVGLRQAINGLFSKNLRV